MDERSRGITGLGTIQITLKRAYNDGTLAVDMDPLSLLCRLAMSVPPPRFYTVKYSGVLASASPWRSRIGPRPQATATTATTTTTTTATTSDTLDPTMTPVATTARRASRYRPWAELLKRTFGVDVLACSSCGGRMKLVAMQTEPTSVTRYLAAVGEPTDVPARSPSRGPPYWKSTILRQKALGDAA